MIHPRSLAVIGAGSKGIALAAKVAALHLAGCPFAPQVLIFECQEPGSMWLQDGGYSDGLPSMCTSADRDLCFPRRAYQHPVFGNDVAASNFAADPRNGEAELRSLIQGIEVDSELYPGVGQIMWTQFSVQAYLTENQVPDLTHDSWVKAGSRHLTHSEFGRYLNWVVLKIQNLMLASYAARATRFPDVLANPIEFHLSVKVGRVTWSRKQQRWSVTEKLEKPCEPLIHKARRWEGFDGVLITGNGEPFYTNGREHFGNRVFNAKDFWSHQDSILVQLRDIITQRKQEALAIQTQHPKQNQHEAINVVVIGAGAAATAVCARLLGLPFNLKINILGRQLAPDLRVPNTFDERFDGSDAEWEELSAQDQLRFIRRFVSGVTWSRVIQNLDISGRVHFVRGEFVKIIKFPRGLLKGDISISPRSSTLPLLVVKNSHGQFHILNIFFDLVIDARGFDTQTRIASFLRGRVLKNFTETNRILRSPDASACQKKRCVLKSLELAGLPPGLHVPDCCAFAGPAAVSLTALNWQSSAILKPHLLCV